MSWNTVECFNLAFKSPQTGEKPAGGAHWVYFPEKKYVFYRAGIYSNIQPSMALKGYYSMYVEVSRNPKETFNSRQSLALILDGLKDAGIVEKNASPEFNLRLTLPYAYVIYDRKKDAALKVIKAYLKKNGIFSIGRYGAWEYSFMERSILDGMSTADHLNNK